MSRPLPRIWTGVPFLAAALTLLGACGDPVQDGRFSGQPRAVLVGVIDQPGGRLRTLPDSMRVGLFWLPWGPDVPSPSPLDTRRLIQQPGVGAPARDADAFRLVLLDEPPLAARPAGYAVGWVLMYDDVDDDGRRGAEEPFYGPHPADGPVERQTDWLTVFWSPAGVGPQDGAPLTHGIDGGYQWLRGPLPCAGPFETGDADCAPRLGAACTEDQDCDPGGRCTTVHGAYNRSQCTLEPAGCRPANGRLVPHRENPRGPLEWLWVAACTADGDCPSQTGCAATSGTCQALGDGRLAAESDPVEPRVCFDSPR